MNESRIESRIREGLTFDDVLLVPGASEVLPSEVDLRTQLPREIALNTPLVAAAMDTVTEHETAIRTERCAMRLRARSSANGSAFEIMARSPASSSTWPEQWPRRWRWRRGYA